MIGELLAVACADQAVLARIAGPIGDAARAAAVELAAATPDERKTLRARLLAGARAPLPSGIRGADPSWIEAGLVGLPARARTAIASGALTEIDVWLTRWACAAIPPLPAASALRPVRSIAEAIRLPGNELVEWLSDIGADQLALALSSAGPGALADVASRSAELGRRLAAAARINLAPRLGALGPVRAAIARCRVELDAGALVRIAARAIAPHVDRLAARQLAVRLPHPLGVLLHHELVGHAHTPEDQCPTWRALAAC